MAKLDRVHQKIFASTAPASDIGVIGSLHEGNPTEATSVQDIQSLAAFEAGIRSIVIGENSPIIEEDNALYKLITYQLAYLFQNSIPEWSPLVEYQKMGMVTVGEDHYFLENALTSINEDPSLGGPWTRFYLSPDMMPDFYVRRDALKRPGFVNDTVTEVLASSVDLEWTDAMSVTTQNKNGVRIYFTTPFANDPGYIFLSAINTTAYGEIRITKQVGGNIYPIGYNLITSFSEELLIGSYLSPGVLNTIDPSPTIAEQEGAWATYKVQIRLFKGGDATAVLGIRNTSMVIVEA